MNEFSMYGRAADAAAGKSEDFGTVPHVSRRDFDERQTFGFRAQVPCLEYLSLLIENALLLRTHRGGRLYAGFQKLSNMEPDRKSTRLNSSHANISYAVFCLKKKKKFTTHSTTDQQI